jgi:hypothetical protein
MEYGFWEESKLDGECSKHGKFTSHTGECPDCMKDDFEYDQDHEYDYVTGLCAGCGNWDIDSDRVPRMGCSA